MAYTYDQFVTAATGAGLLDKFDDEELRIVRSNPEYGMSALKLRQDLQGAKTTEQKMLAQESLNQLRKSYGGNVASSTPPASGTGGTAGSFRYGGEADYEKLLGEVANPKPFEYDYNTDPSFQAMKKTQLREAERATEDTMGSFAGMTGGVPSSAAITAASQAGDYYRSQLTDAIPQLQQNAYQRYLAEIDAKNAALNAMAADRNFDWQKYLAEYDQQFNREQFDWQKYLAEYDQQQSQIQQDAAAKQQEWANAFALYQQLGYATPEIAAILGIPASGGQSAGNPHRAPDIDPYAGKNLSSMLAGCANRNEAMIMAAEMEEAGYPEAWDYFLSLYPEEPPKSTAPSKPVSPGKFEQVALK